MVEHIEPEPVWRIRHTLILLLTLISIVLVGTVIPLLIYVRWLIILALLIVFTTVAGLGVTGKLIGVLIDERNKLSLSRLQVTLWTLIILSALLTIALTKIILKVSDPLLIKIQPELWALMGISITSLVGAPLIMDSKKDKTPNPEETNNNLGRLSRQERLTTGPNNVGLVVVKGSPQDASFSDLFKGDETGNAPFLDLGKVQMFYFTIILVLAYAAQLYYLFASGNLEFPTISPSMVTLLGISHAGYLVNKAVPHSKEQ